MSEKKRFSKEKILLAIGLACVGAGILFNEWIAASFLSSDGTIEFTNKLMIRFAQAGAIGFGLVLIFLRKNKQALMNLGLSIFTLFLCLIMLEIGMRMIGYDGSTPRDEMPLFVENPHGTSSYRLQPDLHITRYVGDTHLVVRTNSLGMRWREVSVEKPEGKQRIAFVGDSFTFGMWADSVEHSFVGVFESNIDTSRYQVLNFGVPGYSLTDIKLQLEEEVLNFDPDIIFLMFYNGNDMRGTYLGNDKFDLRNGLVVWNDSVLQAKLPEHLMIEQGGAEPDRSSSISGIDDLFLYKILKNKIRSLNPPPAKPDTVFKVNENFMKGNEFWSMSKYPEIGETAKKATLETLEEIRELCESRGIALLIGTVPYKEQIYPEKEIGENYNLNFPQKHIEDYAREKDLPYIDLLPTLREYYRKHKTPLHFLNDTHYGNTGNYLMGDTLAIFFKNDVLNKRFSNPKLGKTN